MKVLILGPKARYEAYMPEFVAQLPFETAYCSLDQSPLQAARENADAQILFTDPIVDVTGELMDLMPGLKPVSYTHLDHSRPAALRGGVRHRLPQGLRRGREGQPGHAGAH